MALGALATEQLPWSQDFSEYGVINTWLKKSLGSRNITQSNSELYLSQAATNKTNEYYLWFTGEGFELTAGTSYRFDIDSRSNTLAGTKYFEILLYKKGDATPVYTDEHTSIMKIDELQDTYQTYSAYFEAQESGDFYLCLHAYCDYSGRAMYWDNFRFVEASMDAPAKPEISVTADPTGVLKATVEVTTPSKSIRGNDITSLTKLVVYRDGGVVKEVENPDVNTVVTFTDYVAQPGQHVYSAVAYNEYKDGAQADFIVTVGAEVQTATWKYKALYTPEGKLKIEWPAKAEVTNYQVATTAGRIVAGTPVLDEESQTYTLFDEEFDPGTEANGWQFEVSQVNDDDTLTKLGTTNYLCLNNEIPYYPALNITTALQAFTLDNDPLQQYSWQYYSNGGGCVGLSVSRDYTTKELYNHWLVSPGLKLSKDKFYRVKVTGSSDSGSVTYTIKAGKGNYRETFDIVVAEDVPTVKGFSNMSPVQTDEMFLSVPEDGTYFVGLNAKIPSTVYSDYIRLKRFDIIEVDGSLPSAPTDVNVAYSATGDNTGSISFKLPTKAINGSDVADLSKVEVYKDGELFLTITEGVAPGAELSFDVEVADGVQNVYTIIAFNAAGQGEPATAKVLVLSTPYSNDFNSKNALEGYTRINLKGTTNDFEIQNNRVRLFPNDLGNDHWLITPPITLQAGMYYMLTFNTKAANDNAGLLNVKLGTAPTPEMLTQDVINDIVLDKAENIFYGNREEYFTVAENGQYYLAFHVESPAGRNYEIYIDDLNISAAISGSQPDRGILKVTPASDGSLAAELSYTAATKSLNGTDLNANSTQDVYFFINGVQTPTGRTYKAYPGQTVAITVEVPEDLPYIFSARTGYAGRLSYQDAFVGINRPATPDPNKIVLRETQPYGHVLMTWEPVTTDYEGYPLNPDLLTYDVSVFKVDMYGNPYDEPVLTGITGNSCEFDAIGADEPQTLKRYVLRARNTRGEGTSGALSSYINVGKPYRMPYSESFAKDPENPGSTTAVMEETIEGMCRWGIMTDGLDGIKSADGDGAYIALEAINVDARGLLYTGKVNLGSGIAPSLTLMVHNPSTADKKAENLLEFKIYTHSDAKWHSLGEPRSIDEICNGNPGWNKVTLDLSQYADNVAICGVEATCKSHTFTSIDNIRIWELRTKDLSIQGFNAPVSVAPGAPFTIDLRVSNSGLENATPESVEMYVDGEKAIEAEGTEIAVGENKVFSFTHSFPGVDLATSHELSFKVNYADDEDPSDNESAAVTVLTIENGLAPVENVTAEADDDRYVTLTWDAPEAIEGGFKTETFESWTQGVASQQGWTSYDGDGRNILGVNDGSGTPVVIPGLTSNTPASWAVIDNIEGNLPADYFPALSGSKFLMSICPNGSTGSAEDWMISPELSGKAQTVTFNVLNYSNYRAGYDVLYSDGSMITDDFKQIAIEAVNTETWKEVTVDLPEGAKRFAIRNISYCEDSFMLMLDDVTYESAGSESIALQGYNIYQESECVAQSETTTHKFAEAFDPGKYVFGISARYNNGESRVVPVEIDVQDTGISATIAEGIHVFGGRGCIHITGAEGMEVNLFDINGLSLCSGKVNAEGRIAAAPGIYVVVIKNNSYKVIVK